MPKHIIHFMGPINAGSASFIRNTCLNAMVQGATAIELHMCSDGGNLTTGFALHYFLKSFPLPISAHALGSIESVAVPIFLAAKHRTACEGTRFLVHPLHWGFGNIVAADHARVSEWADCLDHDAKRYIAIVEGATDGAKSQMDVRSALTKPKLLTTQEALDAGLIHEMRDADTTNWPNPVEVVHWWNT